MVIKMSKSLSEMFKETQATSSSEGAKTRETVARSGARLREFTFNEGAKTRETVARGLARTNANVNTRAKEIMDRSDANHADTQRVIREEGARTRGELLDIMEWPEIVFGLILGIIAGLGMWFAEKSVIIKPVQWDSVGNVTKYGPDTFLVIVLAVLFGAFVFFCTTWIVHAIRRRLR